MRSRSSAASRSTRPFAAKNGHSGTAMALAPLGVALFSRVLRHDPTEPTWPDRDRFVLSCGHASILLYSLLHLSGYDLPLDQLRRFRELGSITPGHPENRLTPGVEVTTGPLGQGFSNAVGMAIAERFLRTHRRRGARRPPHVGVRERRGPDGGREPRVRVARRAPRARTAVRRLRRQPHHDRRADRARAQRRRGGAVPRLRLGRPRARRARRTTWTSLTDALLAAKQDTGRPTLLILRSHIGYPAPTLDRQPRGARHAVPAEELEATKRRLGLPLDEPFFVPARGARRVRRVARADARRARELERALRRGPGPCGAARPAPRRRGTARPPRAAPIAFPSDAPHRDAGRRRRRSSSTPRRGSPGCSPARPTSPATPGALLKDATAQSKENPLGRQLHFGIREFAMAGSLTGMALHGGIVPVGATFFVFSDYMRSAIRVAALSEGAGAVPLQPRLGGRSARTARRTSPSTSSARCGRSPAST